MGIRSVESQYFCVSGQLSLLNKQALPFTAVSERAHITALLEAEGLTRFPPTPPSLHPLPPGPSPHGGSMLFQLRQPNQYNCPPAQVWGSAAPGRGAAVLPTDTGLLAASESRLSPQLTWPCRRQRCDLFPLRTALTYLLISGNAATCVV